MKYYRINGNVHAYEADGSQDEFIPDSAVELSEHEVSAHLSPEVSADDLLASLPAVSQAQIIAALISAEVISETEGVAWITGTLPASVEAMIDALPEDRRTIARLRALRPSSVVPSDPLVAALAAAEGKSTQDLIDLFLVASEL